MQFHGTVRLPFSSSLGEDRSAWFLLGARRARPDVTVRDAGCEVSGDNSLEACLRQMSLFSLYVT